MPNLPFRRRHSDPADAPQLDELLDAADLATGDATPEWQSVSDLLRSAAAAAEPSELAGEAAMLAAFRREREGVRHRRLQPIARCKTVLSTLLTGRIAVGLTTGVVTLTGAATAAYACVLPSPIQSFAHDTIGAPAPSTSGITSVSTVQAVHHDRDKDADPTAKPSVSATPSASVSATVSASATKKAEATAAAKAFEQTVIVFHLCKEHAADTAAGKTLDAKDLAVLVKAAGSTASITAYCAALPVLPTTCPTAVPTVKPSATPNDATSKDDGPFCHVCPEVKHPMTATPTASAGSLGDHWFGLDCGNHRGVVNPRVIPMPTINHDGNQQGSNHADNHQGSGHK